MAGQKGRDLLIRIAISGGGYETLAGIRTTRFGLSAPGVDATSADSPDGWRELLAGVGRKQMRVSGSGVFKDAASDARLREAFFTGDTPQMELVVPGLGRFAGSYLISELVYGGEHDGEATFSVTLESAGALAFVVEPGA